MLLDLKIPEFYAPENGGAVNDQYLISICDSGLLSFVFKTCEHGRHLCADLPMRGYDDLGAAHDTGDISASEIFRYYFFVYPAKYGGRVYKVFRGIAFLGGGKGLGRSVPVFVSPAAAIIFPPFMFPAVAPAGEHYEQAYKYEHSGPEESMEGDPGLIFLYQEETSYQDEYQPGAAPETVPYT